ncbi:MAG: 50S ribosomal protein L35 [Candidatus Buchananbacteria bacterium]|nr:50S ribosomal protein L35 [Candidatus Buchananbacteria bacterium]
MPKMKTRKSMAKRFRVTKSKKVIKRTPGQGHFNARETGNTKRNKRRDSEMGNKADRATIRRFVPAS